MTLGRKVIHKLLVFFLFTVTLFCESCTAVAIEENSTGENVLTIENSTKVKTDEIASNSDEKKDSAIEQITKEKDSKDKYTDELNDLYEMRAEFNEILNDIAKKELSKEECKELYEEIFDMISGDE